MTTVRMKVARSALTFATPTLAKIAVSAANIADRIAQNCQEESALGVIFLPFPAQPDMANFTANSTAST